MGYKKNLRALLIGGLLVGTSVTSAFASARDEEGDDLSHPSQASEAAEESQKDGQEFPAAAAAAADAHLAPLQAKIQECGITLEMTENAIQKAERVREDYAPEIELLKHDPQALYKTGKPSPITTGLCTNEDFMRLMSLSQLGHPRARELYSEIAPMMASFGRMDRIWGE